MKKLLGVLVVMMLVVGGAGSALGQSVEERTQRLEREIAELKAELAKTRQDASSDPKRLAEVERRVEILAREIERLKLGEAAPSADRSQFGLGPAASKVYRAAHGVTVGGYGELLYQNFGARRQNGDLSGKTDQIDLLRAVFYFGYKFDPHFVLNSEVEFEHATTGEGAEEKGEVSVEFATLDWMWRPELNVRAGLLLVPVGFINEMHEPTTFLSTRRPGVERAIIPTTWRELGFGLFGDVGPVSYRTYLLNGLNAEGFDATGWREGRQGGSQAKVADWAWAGRVDLTSVPGLLAGVSAFVGNSGQDLQTAQGRRLAAKTSLVEAHLEWRWRGLQARALAARSTLGDAAAVNQALGFQGNASVGKTLEGGYVELGYDVLSVLSPGKRSLTPFVRWEKYDTQKEVPTGFTRNPANDVQSVTYGVAFRPIDQIVVKADFQRVKNRAGTGVNQFNVALGYIF